MKIRISTVVEIPDNELLDGKYKFPSAVQAVFDGLTHYVTCCHIRDSTKWLAKCPKDDMRSTEYRIYKHHDTWYELCKKLDWKYEEI